MLHTCVPHQEPAHLHLLKVKDLLLAGLGLDLVDLVGEAAENLATTHLREEETECGDNVRTGKSESGNTDSRSGWRYNPARERAPEENVLRATNHQKDIVRQLTCPSFREQVEGHSACTSVWQAVRRRKFRR